MADGSNHCLLKDKLSLLRKSSEYSIDHTDYFEEEKSYLHVYREIEGDLIEIIKKVNEHQNKALILVTGSAGDGKSHLLSYLKFKDPNNILEGYHLINDATESDKPSRTAVETLAERLKDFNDENLENGDDNKTIIAVNLGMLNNFIDSEFSDGFHRLREFVRKNDLITNSGNVDSYIEDSYFQNVSFSDYQFFALTKESYDDSYLLEVFHKITGKDDENPFYKAFENCESCSKKKSCPIRANYIFFSDINVQKAIAYKIIEAVTINKVIVTMRRLLDFIYGVLVGPDEELKKLWDQHGLPTEMLQVYLRLTLPFLLNKTRNLNPLSTAIERNNILILRTKQQDSILIRLFSTSDFRMTVKTIENKTPYKLLYFVEESVFKDLQEKTDRDLKTNLILFDLYLQNIEAVTPNLDLNEFLNYLYAYSVSDRHVLKNLWKLASKTVTTWNGAAGTKESNKICFDSSLRDYWLFENCKVSIVSSLEKQKTQEEKIYRFSPTLFIEQKDTPNKVDVDFSLFSLMKRMENGNRPTQEEQDLFIDFSRFVQKIIESGSLKEEILFIQKDTENHSKQYWFRKNDYGEYEFGE